MNKFTTIAFSLRTDYGKEQFRRAVLSGLNKTATDSTNENKIIAQTVIDMRIFGEMPEEWESNPYKWNFCSQLDDIMGL